MIWKLFIVSKFQKKGCCLTQFLKMSLGNFMRVIIRQLLFEFSCAKRLLLKIVTHSWE